jgi:hypothetical protein
MARESHAGFDWRALPRKETLGESARAAFRGAVMHCMAADENDRPPVDELRRAAQVARDQHLAPVHVVALIRTT